jgi:hypothetical protein
MTYIPDSLCQIVISRANHCCEYCLIHQDFAFHRHEIDHILAEKHGGETVAENLGLSCMLCNRQRGSDIASFDKETRQVVTLFNPRLEKWTVHFRLDQAQIVPLTPTGRVTVRLLRLNDVERLIERSDLIVLGLYPC